jgi:hypothetical protein
MMIGVSRPVRYSVFIEAKEKIHRLRLLKPLFAIPSESFKKKATSTMGGLFQKIAPYLIQTKRRAREP